MYRLKALFPQHLTNAADAATLGTGQVLTDPSYRWAMIQRIQPHSSPNKTACMRLSNGRKVQWKAEGTEVRIAGGDVSYQNLTFVLIKVIKR